MWIFQLKANCANAIKCAINAILAAQMHIYNQWDFCYNYYVNEKCFAAVNHLSHIRLRLPAATVSTNLLLILLKGRKNHEETC